MESVILPPKLPETPAKPRPSATLIAINEHNEVLLVQRNKKSRDFSGATVFPGGNFDRKQDGSLEETALRETFEETGLLLAIPAPGKTSTWPSKEECLEAREAIYAHKMIFKQFLGKHGLIPATRCLYRFSSWITPPNYPKRFQAFFFVVFLADVLAKGDRQQYLLTPDTSEEVVSIRFIHPTTALREFAEKKISIPTPQAYNISTLDEIIHHSSDPTSSLREGVRQLSEGIYGGMTLHPLLLVGDGYNGRVIFTYEGDETRGGPVGQAHRSVDWMDAGSFITSDVLHRNFDVFKFKEDWFEKYHPKL
ncbi:hypothetical protein EIP91_000889 [Steccherinum ochraceum]|uniref:Nudix hydrolase domain-containing protein n=1 Tax=Steccherinum ochraceum TaxID=92696 RepID=A0A4R0RQE7_9APHY|nr:hypothetical protein EIP91_000889 [Steccherinum ochraceum]